MWGRSFGRKMSIMHGASIFLGLSEGTRVRTRSIMHLGKR